MNEGGRAWGFACGVVEVEGDDPIGAGDGGWSNLG